MRLYTFVNHIYLSDKQKGIQSAHVVSELFSENSAWNKWHKNAYNMLMTWATDYKTVIVLKGGNNQALYDLTDELGPLADEIGLPMTSFFEDEESLAGAITCVGIIVPAKIYEYDPDDYRGAALTEAELKLFNIIDSRELA